MSTSGGTSGGANNAAGGNPASSASSSGAAGGSSGGSASTASAKTPPISTVERVTKSKNTKIHYNLLLKHTLQNISIYTYIKIFNQHYMIHYLEF